MSTCGAGVSRSATGRAGSAAMSSGFMLLSLGGRFRLTLNAISTQLMKIHFN
jgi:hypothetical protein